MSALAKVHEAASTRDLGNGQHIAIIRQFTNGKHVRTVISDTFDSPGQAMSDARVRLRARLAQIEDSK